MKLCILVADASNTVSDNYHLESALQSHSSFQCLRWVNSGRSATPLATAGFEDEAAVGA